MHEEIIKSLGNDDQYYGEMGRKYLSNSDIGILLSNPAMFKQPSEKTVAMVRGTYFHQLLLEPEKAESTMIAPGCRPDDRFRQRQPDRPDGPL